MWRQKSFKYVKKKNWKMEEKFVWQKEKVKLFASCAKEAIISLRTVWEVNTQRREKRKEWLLPAQRTCSGVIEKKKRFFKILRCDLRFAVIVTRIIEKMTFPAFLLYIVLFILVAGLLGFCFIILPENLMWAERGDSFKK